MLRDGARAERSSALIGRVAADPWDQEVTGNRRNTIDTASACRVLFMLYISGKNCDYEPVQGNYLNSVYI